MKKNRMKFSAGGLLNWNNDRKAVITMAVCDIPDYEFENLARSFLPAMQKYYSSEEGMAAYEKWLSEQEEETLETEEAKAA